MESAKIFILLGLAATASALVCSESIEIDEGYGLFKACLEWGSSCISAIITYPGIASNPTIEFCKIQKSDGSICYSASSDHLCNDITMRTQLKIPTPDLKGDLKFKAGFRRTPAKVCFSGTINVEDCAGSPSIPEPSQAPDVPTRLSEEDRRVALDHHNYLRGHINSPSASNMRKMKYSIELEKFAQGYLDELSNCPLQHNPNNGNYGENVYLGTAWGGASIEVDYTHITQLWYDEVAYYNYIFNRCNAPEGESCGHFTQIVWDKTENVGCGIKQCEQGNTMRTLVVCNYDPPGNVIPYGESSPRRPYISGASCTRCPSTHTSCQNNLCAESGGVQVQEKWNEVEKILAPLVAAQEWQMGSKQTDGAMSSKSDEEKGGVSVEINVSQEAVLGDGWMESVI